MSLWREGKGRGGKEWTAYALLDSHIPASDVTSSDEGANEDKQGITKKCSFKCLY